MRVTSSWHTLEVLAPTGESPTWYAAVRLELFQYQCCVPPGAIEPVYHVASWTVGARSSLPRSLASAAAAALASSATSSEAGAPGSTGGAGGDGADAPCYERRRLKPAFGSEPASAGVAPSAGIHPRGRCFRAVGAG